MTLGTVVRRSAIAAVFLSFAAGAADRSQDINTSSKVRLWKLLDSMGQSMPLTKSSFESVLNVSTYERPEEDRDGIVFIGEPHALSYHLGVSDLELQLDNSHKFRYASLILHGACITHKEVKKKYGPLVIVDSPKGHTPFDDTIAQSIQPWGSYYFVFLDIAADCLHKVALSPRKEEGI